MALRATDGAAVTMSHSLDDDDTYSSSFGDDDGSERGGRTVDGLSDDGRMGPDDVDRVAALIEELTNARVRCMGAAAPGVSATCVGLTAALPLRWQQHDEAKVATVVQKLIVRPTDVRAVQPRVLTGALVGAIRDFPDNTRVATDCVRLLRSALHHGDDDDKDAIVGSGGASAIVAAMRSHPGVETLALAATDALTALASDPTHRDVVTMAGAAEGVAACMRAHPSNTDMQAAGCWLLQVVAFDDGVKSDLMASGCVAAATAALERHASVSNHASSRVQGCLSHAACLRAFVCVRVGVVVARSLWWYHAR